MEKLLQGLLYDSTELFEIGPEYRESLIKELKRRGLIDKKQVMLLVDKILEKKQISSIGKIESIKDIVNHESSNMGSSLRMLILTDYIRKEWESNLGKDEVLVNQLGVLPFFEVIRREVAKNKKSNIGNMKIGVLSGSEVIIPSSAMNILLELVQDGKLSFTKLGNISEDEYVKVNVIGHSKIITGAITELFEKGYINILIVTKSLLGEGWDAPCINSLILASFVGSFMLSNQMRGRAIRTDKNNPNKTSNIWHLVCVSPNDLSDQSGDQGLDCYLLERRMKHFLGLHYTDNTIENGVDRISILEYPLNDPNIKKINKKMFAFSDKRDMLKERWDKSLAVYNKMEVVEKVAFANDYVFEQPFWDSLKLSAIAMSISLAWYIIYLFVYIGRVGSKIVLFLAGCFGLAVLYNLVKAIFLTSPIRKLKIFGNGIREAMLQKEILSTENCKVVVEGKTEIVHNIFLKGGSSKDKNDFSMCIKNFLDPLDNQRYILYSEKNKNNRFGYFSVPELFEKKREDAELFYSCMKKYMGPYKLIYTRNAAGRKILLKGRVKAYGNIEKRYEEGEEVKGALE
ncbi:MAG: hypothetical protein LBM02_00775 [Lachnospiraceae bacterium]|jgi:predicted DNA-binding ribbon-helix-helix protein|nr:hypothetical protein [Lachnospiraceae bacterium]